MAYIGEGNNKLICFLIHLERQIQKDILLLNVQRTDILKSMQPMLHI